MTDQTQPTELLPCPLPWCEGEAFVFRSTTSAMAQVYCDKCHLHAPWKDTEAEAITLWQTRTQPTPAPVDGLVEQLLMTSYLSDAEETRYGPMLRQAAEALTALSTDRWWEGAEAARFYIDCEFDGHGGPLLSFGIVSDHEDGMHVRVTDAPPTQDPWVAANVLPLINSHNAPIATNAAINAVGTVLRNYIGHCVNPVIIADSPVDIARFCQAISTGVDGGWASCGLPLIRFEVRNIDCYPTDLPDAVQHNAWWDAMALRAAIRALTEGETK